MAPKAAPKKGGKDWDGNPDLKPSIPNANTHVLNLDAFIKAHDDIVAYEKSVQEEEERKRRAAKRAAARSRADYLSNLHATANNRGGGSPKAVSAPAASSDEKGGGGVVAAARSLQADGRRSVTSTQRVSQMGGGSFASFAAGSTLSPTSPTNAFAAAAQPLPTIPSAASGLGPSISTNVLAAPMTPPRDIRSSEGDSMLRPMTSPSTIAASPSHIPSHLINGRASAPPMSSFAGMSLLSRSRIPATLESVGRLAPPCGTVKLSDFTALITLVEPAVEFQARVRQLNSLDATVDISWLRQLNPSNTVAFDDLVAGKTQAETPITTEEVYSRIQQCMPPSILSVNNLDTGRVLALAEDELYPLDLTERVGVLINSPRSALALLRTGLSPMDIQQRPKAWFTRVRAGVNNPDSVAEQREIAFEKRRLAKIELLRSEYETICQYTTRESLLEFFTKYDARRPATAYDHPLLGDTLVGDAEGEMRQQKWLAARKIRSQRMITASKHRMLKTLESNIELEERRKLADAAREKFDAEVTQRARERQDELDKAAKDRQRKMIEWQDHLREREKEKTDEIIRKQMEQEERDAARREVLAEQQKQKKLQVEEAKIKSAKRLDETREKQKDELARRAADFDAKKQHAEERRIAHLAAREESTKMQRDKEEEKTQKRSLIADSVKEKEANARERKLQMFKEQEERCAYIRKARDEGVLLSSTQTTLLQEAKLDFAAQQRRIEQFQQLRTIDDLQRKRDRIQRNEHLKKSFSEEVVKEWHQMQMNKPKMMEELQKQAAARRAQTPTPIVA